MVAYLFQPPAGIPGTITRPDETNVEPAMLVAHSSVFAQSFGIPVKYVAGGIQQFSGSEAATDFAGILALSVPQQGGSSASDTILNGGIPNPAQPQDFVVRGYVSVVCAVGTPARGGVVYVQVTADGPVPVGAFRADGTDGGDAVALTATQAEWATDGKDSSGNAEIRVAR